jgi:peptidoglycan/xylan/chitin deacetylase (PgdA/CDA1 family)
MNPDLQNSRSYTILIWICILLFSACAPFTRKHVYDDVVTVTIKEGDTFSTLAETYYSDPSKKFIISEFNDVHALTPGQKLAIPLKPLKRGGLQASGYQTVPVLRYQQFSKNKGGKAEITEAAFESQMNYLKSNGYQVITIDQLIDFLDFKDQIPAKSVVITIDDGWHSCLDIAFPILKKYDFPATLFVHTDLIGKKDALTWSEIRYLAKNGIDIQCHTKIYRYLKELREQVSFNQYVKDLDNELSRARATFREELKIESKYLAYPVGTTNHLTVAFAKKYGFRAGFMSRGVANPFFANKYWINRSSIFGDDDMAHFKEKLAVFKTRKLE